MAAARREGWRLQLAVTGAGQQVRGVGCFGTVKPFRLAPCCTLVFAWGAPPQPLGTRLRVSAGNGTLDAAASSWLPPRRRLRFVAPEMRRRCRRSIWPTPQTSRPPRSGVLASALPPGSAHSAASSLPRTTTTAHPKRSARMLTPASAWTVLVVACALALLCIHPMLSRRWQHAVWVLFAATPRGATLGDVISAAVPPALTTTLELRQKLLASLLLFASSSALAAAETAITALYPWKVRELAESEGRGSPFDVLNKDITRFLTTILVASTLCGVFATALATDVATTLFGAAGIGYATAVITVVILFFGEILPKTLAVHNSDKVVRLTLRPLHLLSLLLYPIGRAFSFLANVALTTCGLENSSEPLVSEHELRLITAGARRSGGINPHESEMIESVLDLEETEVREVMEPRVAMTCVDGETTVRAFLAVERETHYSRYPVFRDNVDNITGVLYVKRLLEFVEKPDELLETTTVAGLADPALFVPESMPVWRVLEQMRKKRIHMAIVVDEYGGTAGLVTLEDIMEEIVGEIYDEDDHDYEQREQEIREQSPGRWLMDGQAELDKVVDALGMKLRDEDLREYGTIGGLLCDRMGGIPSAGDSIVIVEFRFVVEAADDRRIVKVRAERLSEDEVRQLEAVAAAEAAAAEGGALENREGNGGVDGMLGDGAERRDGGGSIEMQGERRAESFNGPSTPDAGNKKEERRERRR